MKHLSIDIGTREGGCADGVFSNNSYTIFAGRNHIVISYKELSLDISIYKNSKEYYQVLDLVKSKQWEEILNFGRKLVNVAQWEVIIENVKQQFYNNGWNDHIDLVAKTFEKK